MQCWDWQYCSDYAYKINMQQDNRLTSYMRSTGKYYTRVSEILFYDVKRKEVLFKRVNVYTGVGSSGLASMTDFKSWLNDIPDCRSEKDSGQLLRLYYRDDLN